MNLFDISGNIIPINSQDEKMPFLSSSPSNYLKEQSDFNVSSFPLIYPFTEFAIDYATQTSTPKVLSITQKQFYETFYDQYLGYHDDLLVTKKNLGKDQSGLYDVWCYDFIPYNAAKKILLSSGMHTYELPASFGLARWVKEYMESDAEVFEYLRQNVQLSIIPIVNPWGFNQNPKKYGNVNGVNPNRNFDDWSNVWDDFPEYSPDPTAPNYNEWNVKGDSPFSEAETQIICRWLKNNTEADFYIDCHTGLNNSAQQFGDIWYIYVSGNVNGSKLSNAATALTTHIQSTYGNTPKVNAVVDAQNSIKQRYGTAVIGIPTITIEQPQHADSAYQTVPNNCKTAIKEYATQIHAFVMAQLKQDVVYNRLTNKIITSVGDSYVNGDLPDNKEWTALIAARNGMTAYNMGVGGESLRTMVTSERYKNINSGSDYIVVFSGHNDVHYDYTPLGEMGDTTATTFYGCLDILCKDLLNLYPSARILFITPTHRSVNYDYSPYVEAMKEVCYKYSIPCWDAFGELGILIGGVNGVTAQSNMFELQPLHLNELGHEYLSYKIEEQLKML